MDGLLAIANNEDMNTTWSRDIDDQEDTCDRSHDHEDIDTIRSYDNHDQDTELDKNPDTDGLSQEDIIDLIMSHTDDLYDGESLLTHLDSRTAVQVLRFLEHEDDPFLKEIQDSFGKYSFTSELDYELRRSIDSYDSS